jgi:hypothetical protein
LPPDIVALPIQCCRIVRNREVDLEELAVRNLAGIVDDLDGFCVIRLAAANGFVVSCFGRSPGIAGAHRLDALQLRKDGFNTPEATPGEYGDLPRRRRSQRRIDDGIGKVGNRNPTTRLGVHKDNVQVTDKNFEIL